MADYLLVFYLVAEDYSSMQMRYAMGPMTKNTCINLTLKAPELVKIYEIEDTIYLCTKIKDFKKYHPSAKINVRYL